MSVPRLYVSRAAWALKPQVGSEVARGVLLSAAARYQDPPPIARTRGGRANLRMAAYLLALRDALVEAGFGRIEAEGLLIDGLYRLMRPVQRLLEVLARARHPLDPVARGRFREHLSRRLLFRAPDWVMQDRAGRRDYAFNVRRCVLADYMRARGEGSFCERVICSQDLLAAQTRGEVLVRRGTIAEGSPVCDFRFVRDRTSQQAG